MKEGHEVAAGALLTNRVHMMSQKNFLSSKNYRNQMIILAIFCYTNTPKNSLEHSLRTKSMLQ